MTEPRHPFSGLTVSEAYELGRQDGKYLSATDDLELVCRAAAKWSMVTFPDQTIGGNLAHLAKEVDEIKKNPDDVFEYADAALLLFDSARLQGIPVLAIIQAMAAKLEKNKKRTWGPPDADGAHHHTEESDAS